ncbi:MAG: trehalose-phosphatase [Acidobacteria bacterium]|jgi:trehalose-phosphatase|nr:MAG: trehalose-phosphatase [Acidobacteriota bacterium]
MRHLLQCWRQVSARIQQAESIALFLDFDGTLAPTRPRPEEVWLDPLTRRILLRLVHHPRLRVWVVSGRRQEDVRERIGVRGVCCLGLYGWERNGSTKPSEPVRRMLAQAKNGLAGHVRKTPGLWIEDKGATFALHYRNALGPAAVETYAVLRTVLEPFSTRLRVLQGDQVWEVAPGELRGKGAVVRREWRGFHRRALPIYVGNDPNDEPAFATLARGVTVRVGPRRTSRARFLLSDPAEVRQFLQMLDAEVR